MKQAGNSKPEASIFKFKQFEISNSHSAMKVNTDGVLLGAWAKADGEPTEIWDVGAGTGVIGLMLAQRFPSAKVTCIEIDPIAAAEARENVSHSPWSDRVTVVEGNIFDIADNLPRPQLIVSNPPYFNDKAYSLRSPEQRKALARHGEGLSFESLINLSAKVLDVKGSLCVVSPAELSDTIEWSSTLNRLSVAERMMVSTKDGKAATRILWYMKKEVIQPIVSYLNIRNTIGHYTLEYRKLVENFYIRL